MKKFLSFFIVLCLGILLIGCKTTNKKQYTIIYHIGNGSTSTIEKTYEENESISSSFFGVSSDNSVPVEWCHDEELKNPVQFPYTVTKNEDFYLRWEDIVRYTVTFVHTDSTSVSCLKDSKVEKPATPTKEGHTFKGWSTDKDTYTEYDFNSPVTKDLTLYAFFEEKQVSVTIQIDESSSITKLPYGSKVEKPEDPSKEGYTFKGWFSEDKEFDFNTSVTKDLTITAKFEIKQFLVSFRDLDETKLDEKSVAYNNKVTVSSPSKEGYTFKGWSKNKDTYEEFDLNTPIVEPMVLYAFYEIKTYTVTFLIDETSTTKTVNHGSTVTELNAPSKTGYTFEGWFDGENKFDFTSPITSNKTLTAKYEIVKLTVSFYNNTTLITTKKVNYNTACPELEDPNILGLRLIGWFKDPELTIEFDFTALITESTSIYGSFENVTTHTVTLVIDGNQTQTQVNHNGLLSVSTPTKPGYTFSCWKNGNSSFDLTTPITEDLTLVAEFTINTYTVTFVVDGNQTPVQVNYMETASMSTPTKTGYTFSCWKNGNSSFDLTTPITEDLTLIAEFTINTYTVTFLNENDGLIEEKSVTYLNTVSIDNPTKTGYNFVGWYKDNALFSLNTPITESITLKARFEIIVSHTVTFQVDSNTTTQTVEDGKKATKPADPTKDNYVFLGWYYDNDEWNFNTPITEDIVLVARFEEASITITASNGYNEGLYIEFEPIETLSLSDYNIYYKTSTTSYTKIDSELIRQKDASTIRVDIIGLPENTYDVKIEAAGKQIVKQFDVTADDRSGYAHFNYSNGIGAYNDDGSLKDNAVVVYVNDQNKNTVKAKLGNTTYTGLVNIIKACTNSSYALDIRILGEIQTTQWNSRTHGTGNTAARQENLDATFNFSSTKSYWDSTSSGNYYKLNEAEIKSLGINSMSNDIAKGITQLNGLTNQVLRDKEKDGDAASKIYEYDSYYNMLDVAAAYNITIEGIGTDASIFQWGFAFKKCNSIEIKNLRFHDYTEDAVGFEGASNNDINYGNYWVHNCTFDIGVNNWDVCYEGDKGDGDGSTDIKYCHNVTISYVQYNHTHKTNLIGAGDSAKQYNITLHHNYYNNCGSRLPLVRQANIHMYNNYYYKSSGYSNSIRANCYALVENCYYEAGQNPYETVNNGAIKAYNNQYVGVKLTGSYKSGNTVTSRTQSVSNTCKPDGSTDYSDFDTNSSLFYYDEDNEVSNVRDLLDPTKVPDHNKTYSGVLKANAKGFPAPTPVEPKPEDPWTNQLKETFSTSTAITELEFSTNPPTTPGIYYSYNGGATGSATNNNVSISGGDLVINDLGDSTTYGYYIFNQTFNTGKVRISIDFKPRTSNTKWAMLHFLDGASNLRICTGQQAILGYSIDGGTTIENVDTATMAANTTYTIVLTIDYTTSQATIQIGSNSVTFAYSNTINGIMFQTAGTNARTFSVDNLKIDTAD